MKKFIFASIALLVVASLATAGCPRGLGAAGGSCGLAGASYAAPVQQTFSVPLTVTAQVQQPVQAPLQAPMQSCNCNSYAQQPLQAPMQSYGCSGGGYVQQQPLQAPLQAPMYSSCQQGLATPLQSPVYSSGCVGAASYSSNYGVGAPLYASNGCGLGASLYSSRFVGSPFVGGGYYSNRFAGAPFCGAGRFRSVGGIHGGGLGGVSHFHQVTRTHGTIK